jgi:hypothetical protein
MTHFSPMAGTGADILRTPGANVGAVDERLLPS